MLELMLCSLFTLVPDYLYRRYAQGKRIGKEITLFSVWFELRWGIIGCLMLTIGLITTIFYFHPSATSAMLFYRTIPIAPATVGRVAEVNVGFSQSVTKGTVLFTLDNSKQEAAVESAKRKIAQVDASLVAAKVDVAKSEAQLQQANADYKQAKDELDVKSELQRRNPGIVPQRDIDKLQVAVAGRQAAIDAAAAEKESDETNISTLLPAEKASAEAALAQAQVELDKTVICAGVDGRVEQFFLRPGDIVNPLMRPAGVLIPEGAGQRSLQAGFGQLERDASSVIANEQRLRYWIEEFKEHQNLFCVVYRMDGTRYARTAELAESQPLWARFHSRSFQGWSNSCPANHPLPAQARL